MANSLAGTYTGTGGKTTGAQSKTDVTIPAHSIAIISFHCWDNTDNGGIVGVGDPSNCPVLNGVLSTHIAETTKGSSVGTDHCQAFLCIGAGTGSGKTLSWTNREALQNGVGVNIIFLDGTETVSPIRASATDEDVAGASTSGAMTFVAGDWTIMTYSSDTDASPTNGGANTALIAQRTVDAIVQGIYYKTANGTIALGGGSATGLVAMTVKAGTAPPPEPDPFVKLEIRAAP